MKMTEQTQKMKEAIIRMIGGIDDEKAIERLLQFVRYLYYKK